MEVFPLLVAVLLCLAVVNGRSFEERRDSDLLSDLENQGLKRHEPEMRHRKRRWQMNYGYDYPRPMQGYYPERREYDNQDLLPKIVKLLEEISYHVRQPRPPPPPQPIYIPYPIPYYVPQYIPCSPGGGNQPNITSRFPDLEDANQNWGMVLNEKDNIPVLGNGIRPISFDPIRPMRPTVRPSPPVDHGSVQKDAQHTTQAPKFDHNSDSKGTGRSPDMCNAAILSCCTGDQRSLKECFSNFTCGMFVDADKVCSSESINKALEAFREAYSPM